MTDSVFSMSADQQVPCTLSFVDAFGNSGTAPAGVPVWVSDHPEFATVTAAADGLTADVVAVGADGVAIVTVTLDALTGTLAVTITSGVITSITIVPGTPVAIPAPTPTPTP